MTNPSVPQECSITSTNLHHGDLFIVPNTPNNFPSVAGRSARFDHWDGYQTGCAWVKLEDGSVEYYRLDLTPVDLPRYAHCDNETENALQHIEDALKLCRRIRQEIGLMDVSSLPYYDQRRYLNAINWLDKGIADVAREREQRDI